MLLTGRLFLRGRTKQRAVAPAVMLSERHCKSEVASGVCVMTTSADANVAPVDANVAEIVTVPVDELAVKTYKKEVASRGISED